MSLFVSVYDYSSKVSIVQITGVDTQKVFAPVPVVRNFFGHKTRAEIDGATVAHFLAAVDSYVEPAADNRPRNYLVICDNMAHEWVYFEDETEACDFASVRKLPVYTPNGPKKAGSESWSIAYGNWD